MNSELSIPLDDDPLTGLRASVEPSEAELERLSGLLVEQANRRNLVDLSYRTVDSPIGTLLVAATEQGLVRVAFDVEGFDDVLTDLAAQVSPRILAGGTRLDQTARELDEYFTGTRHQFELVLDLQLTRGFRGVVQKALPLIPYGSTWSYKEMAERVGNPRAVRAVGSACATNPLPLVLPCHRVTRSDGSYGQYRGGVAAKTALLELEHG